MESMHAVRVAMRVLALPMAGRNHAVAPMPPHVLEVLRIAARSPDTLQQWSNELRMPPDRLVDAANAFIQEVMMPPHANHYRVLGVEPDASMALIRTHYRWLAQGLQAGDAVANGWMLDRANVAFEELSDPLKRSAYDETLGGAQTSAYDDAEDLEPAPAPASTSAETADEDDTVEILALKPEEAGVDPDHWPDETGKFQYVPPEPEVVYPQPRNWLVPAGLAVGIAAGVVLIIFLLNPQPDLPPESLAATEEALSEFETSLPNATYEPEADGLPVFDTLPELPPETEPVAQAPVTPAPRPQAEARPSPPPAQVAARPAPRQEPPPAASRTEPATPPVQAQPEPAPEPATVAEAPPPAPALDPAALARSARPLVERFRDEWQSGNAFGVMSTLSQNNGMSTRQLAPIGGQVNRWKGEQQGQALDIVGLAVVNGDDPAGPSMVATLSTPNGAGMRLTLKQVDGVWRATGLTQIEPSGGPSR